MVLLILLVRLQHLLVEVKIILHLVPVVLLEVVVIIKYNLEMLFLLLEGVNLIQWEVVVVLLEVV